MSKIRPSAVGSLILGIVAGVIAGIAIGRARPPAPPSAPASRAAPKDPGRPQVVLSSTEGRGQLSDDPSALKELVVRQRSEIDTLNSRVEELTRTQESGKKPQDKLALAKELYAAFAAMTEQEEPQQDFFKLLARVEELDESVTPFFIAEYRRAQGNSKQIALWLALTCGGKDAVELIKELARSSSTSPEEQDRFLGALGHLADRGPFSAGPLPIDSELVQIAFQLAESSRTRERSGGVALLGRYDDPSSRAKLQQLAGSEPDVDVRASVLQALGNVGDRATLAYLTSYPSPDCNQYSLQSALKGAIAKLKKRFPE